MLPQSLKAVKTELWRDPSSIVELMNKKGAAKVPFLFAFDFELSRGFFIEEPFGSDDVLFSLRGKGNKPKEAPFNGKAELIAFPLGYEEYLEKFQVVQKGLMRGDSFLVNLTVKTPIETNLSLYDIFIKSDSLFQLYVPGLFVCFSPEIFVSIENGEIKTYPMKGTIPADIPNAQERILKDPKETAEHATIVDLLRNDLSINADEVKVRRYRYIDKLKTSKMEILQVSSEIVGKLPLGWEGRIGDIIYRMLPAGSCSGAPKESTLRIIRESEGQSRGFYTGIFGLFDGVNMDSAVLIRFIEEDGGQKYFRSGGGITAQSLATDEYQEAIDKIYLPFV